MSEIINIFRADNTNAGDWWSPPIRYFRFKKAKAIDIFSFEKVLNTESVVIVGGGGLGRPVFEGALTALRNPKRRYKLISWGVGCDVSEDRGGTVTPSETPAGSYFSGFDENGLRIFPSLNEDSWLPCSSCMWHKFDYYRKLAPKESLGFYEHKRVQIADQLKLRHPNLNNSGDSIEEKVAFLARFQVIVTNSYHGVYWATLLNRKVVCIPFKGGLYTFKHKPAYILRDLSEVRLQELLSYPNALEECREANIDYLRGIVSKYQL